MLQEYRGGMETAAVGIQRGWNLFLREPHGDALEISQTVTVLVHASVRTLGKLSREMSYAQLLSM